MSIVLRLLGRLCLAASLVLGAVPGLQAGTPATVADGERLYLEGQLPSGAALHGALPAGSLDGAAAACANCHQRSGLGSYEGPLRIPPIIGPYLFRDRRAITQDLRLPHIPGFTPHALAYDRESLDRALRTGSAPGGRTLGALMPRYSLDGRQLDDLVAYLEQLGSGTMAGVSDESLEFATVVAPGADPGAQAGMLDVLRAFFAARNDLVAARIQGSGQQASGEYRAARRWHLNVWVLDGPPDSWPGQLRDRQSREPVFALVAGIGRGDWGPIDHFCEQARLPCLMAEAEQPAGQGPGHYAIHYSRGVFLEADLIRRQLLAASTSDPADGAPAGRIVQVFRTGDVGAAAAAALAGEAHRQGDMQGFVPESRALGAEPVPGDLAAALEGLGTADAVVLWLRPGDVAALGDPGHIGHIYLSGLMAGLESAPLPPAWRTRVQMSYPFDTAGLRRVRMNFPHAWLRNHGIALRDDRVQSDTWLTCMILADALDSMLDSYVPDYLVERVAAMLEGQHSSAYYPRLGLANGQRFASKGGYIVRYEGAPFPQWVPATDWIVP
jgi:mono/diheme cytochrome c family protein